MKITNAAGLMGAFSTASLLIVHTATFAQGVKVSALPSATIPLAGTEQLPVVQGGATKRATIGNILAGVRTTLDDRHVATVCVSGKFTLRPLTTTALTPSAVDATSTGVSFKIRVAAPGAFDMVRIGIPNQATTAVTGVRAALLVADRTNGWVSSLPNANGGTGLSSGGSGNNSSSNPNTGITVTNNLLVGVSNAVTWSNGTKAEIDLPAAVASNYINSATYTVPTWSFSDWMPITSVARVDGGTFPLIDVNVAYPPSTYTPVSGASASYPGVTGYAAGFANWGIDGSVETSRPNLAGRMWKAWGHPSNSIGGVNYQGINQPVTLAGTEPAIIVQFHTTAETQSILYLNDSIGEYTSGGEYGDSAAFKAARAVQASTGKQISWCALTAPSGSIMNYGIQVDPLLQYIRPTILWAKPIGPNEATTTLTAGWLAHANGNAAYFLKLADRYKSKVILEPMIAMAGTTFSASDSYRQLFNAGLQNNAATYGYTFADIDTVWSNSCANATSGQCQPAGSNSYDGVHPSETGNVAMSTPDISALTTVINQP